MEFGSHIVAVEHFDLKDRRAEHVEVEAAGDEGERPKALRKRSRAVLHGIEAGTEIGAAAATLLDRQIRDLVGQRGLACLDKPLREFRCELWRDVAQQRRR